MLDTNTPVKYVKCAICKGAGMLTVPLNQKAQMPCPTCNMTGKIKVD